MPDRARQWYVRRVERFGHQGIGRVDLFTRMIRLKAGALALAVFAVTPCSDEFFTEAGALQFVSFPGFARFTQRARRKNQMKRHAPSLMRDFT